MRGGARASRSSVVRGCEQGFEQARARSTSPCCFSTRANDRAASSRANTARWRSAPRAQHENRARLPHDRRWPHAPPRKLSSSGRYHSANLPSQKRSASDATSPACAAGVGARQAAELRAGRRRPQSPAAGADEPCSIARSRQPTSRSSRHMFAPKRSQARATTRPRCKRSTASADGIRRSAIEADNLI